MIAVGKTIIIKLMKEKDENGGETVQDNGLITVGSDASKVEDILSKWEGEVMSIGDEVADDTPVKVGGTIRVTENSGIPISEDENDTHKIRYVSVRYGDILAVM